MFDDLKMKKQICTFFDGGGGGQKSFSRIEPHYLISCNIGLPHWFDHYNRSTFLFGLGRTYCSGV